MKSLMPLDAIERRIYLIRGHKVMLSPDLAALYGVEPRTLIQAVKRNRERFPPDFMFQLTLQEARASRSQIVILNEGKPEEAGPTRGGNIKYSPYAFTEQGVSMLSSVLRSRRAVQVNIAIMRAFVRLREMVSAHKDMAVKLAELERKLENHDEHIQSLFEAIRQLMEPPEKPRRQIGFKP